MSDSLYFITSFFSAVKFWLLILWIAFEMTTGAANDKLDFTTPEECIEAAKEEASALQMMFGNPFIFVTVAPDDVLKQQAVVSRAKMMAALEWLIKNNIWCRHSRIPDHSSLDYDSASAGSLIISQTVPSASAGSQITPG